MTDSTKNEASGRYRVIDTHAHIVLEETFGAAGKYGPRLGVNHNNATRGGNEHFYPI